MFTALAVVTLAAGAGIEGYHRLAHGHFFAVGLHADVEWLDAAIGGPEPSRMYWPVLTNFGLWPATLEACNYMTDTTDPGTDYAVALQRWNADQKQWEMTNDLDLSLEELCSIAIPTSRGPGSIDATWVWPGFSVDAIGPEAIGAREDFDAGDLARFVIFRTARRSPDWRNAVFSDAFAIKVDTLRGVGARTKH